MTSGTEIERILVRIVADATMYDRVMDRVVGRMTQTAARLTSIGRTMSLAVTAPLLAMATISVAAAGQFEYSAARIQGASNMTTRQIGAMKMEVRNMARELGMKPTALIDTFEELTKGGMNLTKILEGSGKAAAMLSKVGGVDTGVSAKTLVKILNIFQNENMSAAEAANILSAAADASVISIEDMIHSISQGSSMAAQASQKFVDFSAAVGLLGQAGLVSRDAGTSLKTFFMSLVSSERAKYFEKYGLQVRNAAREIKPFRDLIGDLSRILGRMAPADQLKAVSEMFGSDAARAAIVLSRAGVKGFDAMKTAMMNAMTVEEKYNLLLKTFNGQLERAIGLLLNIGITLGEKLVPYLTALSDSVERAIVWWNGLNNAQQDFLFQAGLYAMALGPALIMLGRMIGIVQVLGRGFWFLGGNLTYAFTSFKKLLMALPNMLLVGITLSRTLGAGLLLGLTSSIAGMGRYLITAIGALWRVVAIAAAPVVSLFAPFVMDIVYVIGGIGLAIVRMFSFLPRAIMPIFSGLWVALTTFVGAMPAVFAGFRIALMSFVSTLPAVFAAFQTAAGVLIPWVVSLGTAMFGFASAVIMPIIGMLSATVMASMASIAAGIGGVLATILTVAALPVVVIGGIIAIVEGLRYLVAGTTEVGKGFDFSAKSAMNFFKGVLGGIANIGQNWDLFVGWFKANWVNMFVDALKIMGQFFLNMGNNTLVAVYMLAGMFGMWVGEMVSYIAEGFGHGWDIVTAWITDTLVAFKDWSVRVGAMIWDALSGDSAYNRILKEQSQRVTSMSQVGEFKPKSFGAEYDNMKMDFLSEVAGMTRSPLEGFKASTQALPKFNTQSETVDNLFANGLGFLMPKMPELPPPPKATDDKWLQDLLQKMNTPTYAAPFPDLAKKEKSLTGGKAQEGPGDTFKQTSLRRFIVEGPGGLARKTAAEQAKENNKGIEDRLDSIKQVLLLSKGIIR